MKRKWCQQLAHTSREKKSNLQGGEKIQNWRPCVVKQKRLKEKSRVGRGFFLFFKKVLVLFSHLCFKLWKESLFEHFFVRLSSTWGIYSHLLAEFTPDAHISPENTDWLFSTWDTASVKHCTQLLFDSQPGILAHRQETHTAAAEAKIELVWAFLGCLKHRTCLWPLRFNKDYKTHAEKPLLCSGASSPYASSQSRGDVSRSTNVNIAARVGELSNTLMHNLF